jgi:hypothetical protein
MFGVTAGIVEGGVAVFVDEVQPGSIGGVRSMGLRRSKDYRSFLTFLEQDAVVAPRNLCNSLLHN